MRSYKPCQLHCKIISSTVYCISSYNIGILYVTYARVSKCIPYILKGESEH